MKHGRVGVFFFCPRCVKMLFYNITHLEHEYYAKITLSVCGFVCVCVSVLVCACVCVV